MEDILPDMKIIIEKSNGTTQTMLPLESFIDSGALKGTGGGTGGNNAGTSAGGAADDTVTGGDVNEDME